jgi:hypothetical protein
MSKMSYNGFTSLKSSLAKVTRKLDKQDPMLYRLVKYWDEIIGEDLCELCAPIKVTYYNIDSQQFATLYVETLNSAAAMRISFATNMLTERIASYFGHRIINRIKIMQNIS